MILFNIGVFLTSKILEHTIDDIFHSFKNPRHAELAGRWNFENNKMIAIHYQMHAYILFRKVP